MLCISEALCGRWGSRSRFDETSTRSLRRRCLTELVAQVTASHRATNPETGQSTTIETPQLAWRVTVITGRFRVGGPFPALARVGLVVLGRRFGGGAEDFGEGFLDRLRVGLQGGE